MEFQTKHEGPWLDIDENSLLVNKVGEWRYQRPAVKTEKCAHCGTCQIFCPTGCIQDMGSHFAPDLEFCKGCGICAAVCPVSAIKMIIEGNP